jgi:hypothetical protein
MHTSDSRSERVPWHQRRTHSHTVDFDTFAHTAACEPLPITHTPERLSPVRCFGRTMPRGGSLIASGGDDDR